MSNKFTIEDAVDYFTTGDETKLRESVEAIKWTSDGGQYEYLIPKGSREDQYRVEITRRMTKYVNNPSNRKPVAIGVFGPPGSGKTTMVKAIARSLEGIKQVETINLSQLGDIFELEQQMQNVFDQDVDGVRLVFIDEFDSELDSKPLGWLKWFLAPMLDGEFVCKKQFVKMGRTILVFAGGTASSLKEFEVRHRDHFVVRKAPDFLSRLKGGIIRVEGVNTLSDYRFLKRTIALRFELQNRAGYLI